MVFVIGLAVRGVKTAHKAHRKHQAEKGLREQGMLDDVRDYEFDQPEQPSRSNRDTKHPYTHHNSRSSSVDSAEAEAQLEHDVDYQRFIARQKQVYLDQRRGLSSRESGGAGRVEVAQSSTYYPSTQPPAYDSVVAENTSSRQRSGRTSRGLVQINQAPIAEVSDQGVYMVSPVAPTNTRWDSHSARVEEAESVSPVSPVDSYSSTSKYQGEKANTRV